MKAILHRIKSRKCVKIEQLERLRSENTPHRPMITHIIDSYQVPSQKNMEILQFCYKLNMRHTL